MNYQPVFLIGAARSGTKLLRDTIASHPQINSVPYDVNFIWRLGNESLAHDELTSDMLTPKIADRIRGRLESYRHGSAFLIEKTVSNCLRVPFVESVFPEAVYIFLVRDGRDVIESSFRQWNAPPDWSYVRKKALSFPITEAPNYALKYAYNLTKRLADPHGRPATWGPRYNGIDHDVRCQTLMEVCAIQWARSIQHAYSALQALDGRRTIIIRYEEFVQSPVSCLRDIADFLGIYPEPYFDRSVLDKITAENVGKGWRRLPADQQELILNIAQDQMKLLGYLEKEPGLP